MISCEISTYTHMLIFPFLNIHSVVLSYPHVYGPEGICSSQGIQERASDPLELKLQTVVS